MEDKLYSLDRINSISRGNPELIKKLINLFIVQALESVNGMKIAYMNKDFSTFRCLAHKVKPTYGYFGIKDIEGHLQMVEMLTRIKFSADEITHLMLEIEEITDKVVEEMKSDFKLN